MGTEISFYGLSRITAYRRFFTWFEDYVVAQVHDQLNQEKKALFREYIPVGSTVAEVGVGCGQNMQLLAERVNNIVAVEPNYTAHSEAKKRAKANGVNLQVHQGNAESLPLETDSVDGVVLTFVLCSVTSTSRALEEVKRVLKPGGALIFVEHVHSKNSLVWWIQEAMTPLQRFLFNNCHLTRRPHDDLPRFFAKKVDAGEISVPLPLLLFWMKYAFHRVAIGAALK